MRINNKKIQNAVIGFPLDHTLSPVLHNALYKELQINAKLKPFVNKDIEKSVKIIKENDIQLTAITMPHKQSVIKYLDEIDLVAKKLNSVNTIINKNGRLYGYNTDIIGIQKTLEKVELKNKNVLIIGAGGVARPVAYHITQCGGLPMYLNRTKEKAEMLKDEFGGKVVEEKELDEKNIEVIINTTPIGMYSDVNLSPLDKKFLSKQQIIFDIIYNPLETQLIKNAKAVGAETISGIEMFVYQGVRQVELWRNVEVADEIITRVKDLLIEKMEIRNCKLSTYL